MNQEEEDDDNESNNSSRSSIIIHPPESSSCSFYQFIREFDHEKRIFPFLQPNEIEEFNRLHTDLSDPILLNSLTSRRILDKILSQRLPKETQDSLRKNKRSSEVKQAFILLLIQKKLLHEEHLSSFSFHEEEWKKRFHEQLYPVLCNSQKCKMKHASSQELTYLIHFYYLIEVLNQLLPAKQNKNLFIRIAGELDGSSKRYIIGGKNSPETQRRSEIFEYVTGVPPRIRDNSNQRQLINRPSGESLNKTISSENSSNNSDESKVLLPVSKPSFELTFSEKQITRNVSDIELLADDFTEFIRGNQLG